MHLEAGIAHLLRAWPDTRVVLLTQTPCSAIGPNASKSKTLIQGCDSVPALNHIIRSIASRHAPRAQLLDAHQMVVSRQDANSTGTPTGLWESAEPGIWHFSVAKTPQAWAQARTRGSAEGEMDRSIANRLLNMLCEHSM